MILKAKPLKTAFPQEIFEEEKETIINPASKFNIGDLMKKATAIQEKCKDFTVSNASANNLQYSNNSLSILPDTGTDFLTYPMTRFALGQLCTKLGVPVSYILKCLTSGKVDLAQENINNWIENFNKNLLVRVYSDKIRGILSNRYLAFDTPDILEAITSVLDSEQCAIKGYHLSPERFHARIVNKNVLDIPGEDLFAGIQIDSSDVGRSRLFVHLFIFKQICTNGLCAVNGGGVLFEQRHIGITLDSFRDDFGESVKRIPDLISHVKELIEYTRKQKILLSQDELKVFSDRLKKQTRLSDDAVNKCLTLMQNKYSSTAWGAINAITEVAQDYSLERRIELEGIAGSMLYSPHLLVA